MIYVYLAPGFEEIEALTPVDMLRRSGLDVKTVGVGGKTVSGSHGISVVCDIEISESVLNEDLQMIILPGGMPGTVNLKKNENVINAIRYCDKNGIYIAAICAAPSILGELGLLSGKNAVCYPGFEKYLCAANVLTENVCADGKFITSRGMGTASEFSLKLVEILKGKASSDELKKATLC